MAPVDEALRIAYENKAQRLAQRIARCTEEITTLTHEREWLLSQAAGLQP